MSKTMNLFIVLNASRIEGKTKNRNVAIRIKLLSKGRVKMYSLDELDIIKTALEGDIIRQKKEIEEIDDIRFQKWLFDTEELYKKVSNELFTRKAKKQMLRTLSRKQK